MVAGQSGNQRNGFDPLRVQMVEETPPLVVIVGETASGKSALALGLAENLGGEIICADSWTVRREVNIGTAKPTAAERATVPHHLLDIVDPDEDFTAAVFKDRANAAITDIASRGKLPIMVGGTGLYIDGVLYDFGFLPEGDRTARQELNALSPSALLQRIQATGIELGVVDQRNKRRLIRLLETNGQQPRRAALRPNTLILGLHIDRQALTERITKRADAMLAAGLEAEVEALRRRYGWECEALKGVGYREWQAYFKGSQSLAETRAKIVKSTLNLAKRQRTWFKRNKSIHWFSTPVNVTTVVDFVTTSLNTKGFHPTH
jgi:tRNA dimethylallyltransferase